MIYLYLGSSLADGPGGGRRLTIVRALNKLSDRGIDVVDTSSIYEAEPYPKSSNPWFVCMVAAIETEHSPIDLLQECKLVEYELGRSRNRPGTPRVIDIDLLVYNNITDERLGLTIPHENLPDTAAYLIPLQEIDPDWIHPETDQPIQAMVNQLSDQMINKLKYP